MEPPARSERALNAAYADAIRLQRLARRWTQTDLADRLGTTRAVVAQIEAHKHRRVTVAELSAACAVFGCDMTAFLMSSLALSSDDRRDIIELLRPLLTPPDDDGNAAPGGRAQN